MRAKQEDVVRRREAQLAKKDTEARLMEKRKQEKKKKEKMKVFISLFIQFVFFSMIDSSSHFLPLEPQPLVSVKYWEEDCYKV